MKHHYETLHVTSRYWSHLRLSHHHHINIFNLLLLYIQNRGSSVYSRGRYWSVNQKSYSHYNTYIENDPSVLPYLVFIVAHGVHVVRRAWTVCLRILQLAAERPDSVRVLYAASRNCSQFVGAILCFCNRDEVSRDFLRASEPYLRAQQARSEFPPTRSAFYPSLTNNAPAPRLSMKRRRSPSLPLSRLFPPVHHLGVVSRRVFTLEVAA